MHILGGHDHIRFALPEEIYRAEAAAMRRSAAVDEARESVSAAIRNSKAAASS